MPDTTRLYDLLAEWEERRQQGTPPTAEQLCPDDPALQDELRRRIARQLRVRAVIDPPAATAGPPPLPVVAGYDIRGVIGRGGMGVVYRAEHRQLNRVVALKMILGDGVTDPHALARFRDEARAVAALQHPNIVQVFDAGEAGGRPYLALEYVPGGSLADHLAGAPADPRRAAELVRTVARAVQHAHDQGIVHRDLKPANVLLAPDGTPKVTDFGLAKRVGDDSGRTRTGVAVGSPSYMPPEQAAGESATVGPAADVYALGAVLYELLTGRPPFVGVTALETIRLVSEQPPVEPRALQPGVPTDLQVVCLKCLEKQPADRYPTAAALADDLGRFLAGDPILARPPSALAVVTRTIRRGNMHHGFARWGRWLVALSPLPPVIHLAAYFGLHHLPDFPVWMSGISLAVILSTQFVLNLSARPVFATVPSGQRRHFRTVWAADCVADVLIWVVLRLAVPADHPDLMYLAYPLWVLSLGHTYLAFASEAGGLYLQGAMFYLVALALTLLLPWSPLVVAGVMFVNMAGSGLFLRRGVGTRPDPTPTPAGQKSGKNPTPVV